MINVKSDPNESALIVKPLDADLLKKMICKLRWIGQDQAAERMCAELSRLRTHDTILSAPSETD